jgi:hypothetical protein
MKRWGRQTIERIITSLLMEFCVIDGQQKRNSFG